MTALMKFLKVLILGALVIALTGAFVGIGYWQYTRQAELLDGFDYIAWNSDYQRQIKTIEDGEDREFEVMALAARYDDHWIVGYGYPSGYIRDDGADLTNFFQTNIYWDAECVDGSTVETGEKYTDGRSMTLECVDGDKLLMNAANNLESSSNPWDSMPEDSVDYGGFEASFFGLKYWPWDEAKKFATLQKATMSSDSD